MTYFFEIYNKINFYFFSVSSSPTILMVLFSNLFLILIFSRNFVIKKNDIFLNDIKNAMLPDANSDQIDKVLHFFQQYRITNLYLVIFRFSLLLILPLMAIFFLRFFTLGNKKDILFYNFNYFFNFSSIVSFLCLILIIFLLILSFEKLFRKDLIRIYFYFYPWHKSLLHILNTKYLDYGLRYNFKAFLWKIIDILDFPLNIEAQKKLFSNLEYLHNLDRKKVIHNKLNFIDNADWDDYLKIKIYNFINQKSNRLKGLTIIINAIKYLSIYVDSIIREISWILMLIAIIVDLNNASLYYIYYAIFYFFLIIFYRRVLNFIYSIDWAKDPFIYDFLYDCVYLTDSGSAFDKYLVLHKKLDISNNVSDEDQKEYLILQLFFDKIRNSQPFFEIWIKYFQSGLNVHAIDDNSHYKKTVEYTKVRRAILIVINIISLFYIAIFHTITCDIYFLQQIVSLNICYFFILLLTFLLNLWQKSSKIFWVISMIIPFFAIFILIRHSLPLIFSEYLFTYNSFFVIIDFYTVNEKLLFFNQYLQYCIEMGSLENTKDLFFILKKVPIELYITDRTSFATIKVFIINIIQLYVLSEELSQTLLSSINMET